MLLFGAGMVTIGSNRRLQREVAQSSAAVGLTVEDGAIGSMVDAEARADTPHRLEPMDAEGDLDDKGEHDNPMNQEEFNIA